VLNFTPTTEGLFAATIGFSLASHNAFQTDLALPDFTLTVRGRLAALEPPPPHGVPDASNPLVLGALTLLGLWAASRIRRQSRS